MNGHLYAPLKLPLKILSSPQKCPPVTSRGSHRGFSHEVNKPQGLATRVCLLRCMLARVCCLIPVTCTVHTSFLGPQNQCVCATCSPCAPPIHSLPLPSFQVCPIGDSRQEFREKGVQQSFYFPKPSTLDCGVGVAVLLYQSVALSYSNPSPQTKGGEG